VSFFDVHESKRPGAPTVLLSSGLGGTAGYWAPQLAALTAHCRVITYDQAGTGRNKRDLPDDHSIGAMGDEILAVLDATKTGRAHIVGHALGGLAGLDVAIRQRFGIDRINIACKHQRRNFLCSRNERMLDRQPQAIVENDAGKWTPARLSAAISKIRVIDECGVCSN